MQAKHIIATILAAFAAATSHANGSRLPSQDALAVARGYAFTASADNLSAIYFNPAGLAQATVAEVESGAHFLSPTTSYSGANGTTANLKSRNFVIPYLYAGLPLTSVPGAVVGFGVYSPFGLSTDWPVNGPFRTIATHNQLTFVREVVTFAYDFRNGLMLGGSFQHNSIEAKLNQGVGMMPGDNFGYDGKDSTAWSYDLGIIWRPAKEHSFGLHYQSNVSFGLKGTVALTPYNFSESGSVNWPFPSDIAVGYSYRPTPDWNIEVGYDQTNWSSLKTIVLNRSISGPLPLVFNWKDSGYYGVGFTHYLENWHYSAGLNYSANSVNDSTWSPSVADYSRWLWNIGAGYKLGPWTFESVFQWNPSSSRTIHGSPLSAAGQTADGTYTSKLVGFSFQGSFKW